MTNFDHPPCKECGKTSRYDYDGYCMDCADENGISEVFPLPERYANLDILAWRRFSLEEKKANLQKMNMYVKQRNDENGVVWPILVRRK